MRLINTHTRQFREFIGNNIPPYAILSHTWEEEEVTYKHYTDGNHQNMKGYAKIDMTCRLAEKQGLEHAWVDTCCIDKSSSAELSEAINSMFRWYKIAVVCYVYLSDLPAAADWSELLCKCRWFTRGWTLQELIAPTFVMFFDSVWESKPNFAGTKEHLASELSTITKIDQDLLIGVRSLTTFCVAQKMSWAALRTTTRVEDIAYCLLGLFDLNMPLLYGEGEKAFRRLQEEIIRSTTDLSIFAWQLPPQELTTTGQYLSPSIGVDSDHLDIDSENYLSGMLSNSPAEFTNCQDYERIADDAIRELAISNVGIRTRIQMFSPQSAVNGSSYALVLPLHCISKGWRLGVLLRQVSPGRYLRRNPWGIHRERRFMENKYPETERILLTQMPTGFAYSDSRVASSQEVMRMQFAFILRIVLSYGMSISNPWPSDLYYHEDELFALSRTSHRDFRIIDVTWRFKNYYGGMHIDEEHRCSIIALNWSNEPSLLWNTPQFSIVEGVDCLERLGRVKKVISESYGVVREVLRELEVHKISRTSSVHFPIPGTDLIAMLSIKPHILVSTETDSVVCTDLKVEGRVYKGAEAPKIEVYYWYTVDE